MEKQPAKRGRPAKSAPQVAVETATPKAKKPSIKRNIPDLEAKPSAFVPVNGKGGIILKLRNSKISTFDKEKNAVREIRYAPLEQSIYVDEQSDNPTVEQVFIYDKLLVVPLEKPNLREFLQKHPDNRANGGSVFEELNTQAPKATEVNNEFLVHDAVAIIKSKPLADLIPLAMSLRINIDQDDLSVKRDLVRYARRKPQEFLDMTTNPLVEIRGLVSQAFDFDIVRDNGGAVVWYDTNKVIVTIPAGQSHTETLSRFCMTDAGATVRSEIERQLAEIA